MHSKVIIASLVCALATSFNNGKFIANPFSKASHSVEEGVSCAPNDYHQEVDIANPCGNAGTTVLVTLNCENPFGSGVGIDDATEGLNIHYSIFTSQNRVEFTVVVPTQAGDYFVKFGDWSWGKYVPLGSVYIYSNGSRYYASSLSANDARAKFFMEYMVTDTERSFLDNGREYYTVPDSLGITRNASPSRASTLSMNSGEKLANGLIDKVIKPFDPTIPIIPNRPKYYAPTAFDAEKRFGEFVYGTQDITTTRSVTRPIGYNGSVTLRLHANWLDKNGASHPLAGMYANFLTPADCSFASTSYYAVTDTNGVLEVVVPRNVAVNYCLNEVQFRIASVNRATYVEDYLLNNYPYCYSLKSSVMQGANYLALSTYSYVDYYVTVRPNKSDRAAAYEICQAQGLPYDYVKDFAYAVNPLRTVYPAPHTEYHDWPWYDYVSYVQQEDARSWDVLNHEYAHYIDDMLSLCYLFGYTAPRRPHGVHENLANKYGDEIGKRLAFSEGLATYIGIASQLYFKENNPNANITGVGDEVYEDSYRGLTVDYGAYAPGATGNNIIQIEAIESAITSTMLKFLDDGDRYRDRIAWGHQEMWNFIRNGGCNTLNDFIAEALLYKAGETKYINYILDLERNVTHVPQANEQDAWTIMIYMCGSTLENPQDHFASDNIEDILKVNGQPENVNVIIQTGGSTYWHNPMINPECTCRFKVKNHNLIPDNDIYDGPLEDMGNQATFEDFLYWGLTNYPAQKTGVILWNHGFALNGCCNDEYSGNMLTNYETASACEEVFYELGISKLEFIGYDCCEMQLQDVAEFNSNYFNYMVASEEDEGEKGWVYDKWLDNVYDGDSTENILREICDTYTEESGYIREGSYEAGTLSVLKLSNMAAYKTAFENLASNIYSTVRNNFNQFKSVITGSYGFNSSYTLGTYDGKDFLTKLLSNQYFSQYSYRINAALTAYNNLVLYHRTVIARTHGLAIHVDINSVQTYDINQTHFYNWRSLFY